MAIVKRSKIPRGYSRHHRKPKVRGGTWDEKNISIITKHKHQLWHALFGVITPESIGRIVQEITNIYLDPSYKILVVRKGGDTNVHTGENV